MLLAVCQGQGIEGDWLPRAASAFGGGIGGAGATCGALVGAVMALSVRMGRERPEDDIRPAYKAAQALHARFEAEMGSASCRALTGLDLRTREGAQALYQTDVFDRVCLQAGAVAARLAEEALAAGPTPGR